ncbi:MAG: leucine-rich repeat protein, partial [Clostridia bacterium]|nr:leucine-rich repeat protein [Clostridia bacterium]
IDGGSSYKQDIVNAIMASKLTVLLWSKNAAASLDIPREIGIALEERKHVIPFLLDTTPFTPSLRYDLTGVQQTKGYGKSFSDCIADLADDIAKKLKGTKGAPAQPGQLQPAAVPAESKLAPMAPAIQETQLATQPDVQKIITYELRNGGYTVTGVPDMERFAISESINGLPVVAIGKNAFKDRNKVKYVKLPASLRLLEDDAFRECHCLRELEIPEGVTEIGSGCFYLCDELVEINLPSSLRKMGTHVFSCCQKLKKIEIPPNVTVMTSYCFVNCLQLTEVILPDGLKRIQDDAFAECTKLRQVMLPDGLEYVHGTAFVHCSPELELVVRENTATHRALEREGYFGTVKKRFDLFHPFSGKDRPKVKIVP